MSRKETEFLFQNQFKKNPGFTLESLEDKDINLIEENDNSGVIETDDGELIFDVTKGRSEDFTAASESLSSYIKALPLSQEQNNELVQRAVNAVVMAERDAFMYAFSLVLSAVEAAEEETGEEIL